MGACETRLAQWLHQFSAHEVNLNRHYHPQFESDSSKFLASSSNDLARDLSISI